MATEMKGRGTVFKFEVATVLTAVPLIETISVSGQETETTEVKTLDGAVGIRHIPTGFAKVAQITLKFLLDIANTVHLALHAASITPGAVGCSLTYTDAGPVTKTFSAAGVGFDVSVDPSKPVEATCKIQTSGLPT